MNTIVTPGIGAETNQRPGTKAKIGLGLTILMGVASLPSILTPTPDGEVGPPFAILVLGTVLGLASIITAVWAWRTGDRLAIRLTAAAVIVNTVAGLPGIFADIPPALRVATAVFTLLAVVAVVLMFSRSRSAGTAD